MSQAARVVVGQRWFNLVVTNVPGPQHQLYLLGRELRDLIPMVPLAPNQALGIAVMSYNGRMAFGLVGDYDVVYDLDDLAADFGASLGELAETADVHLSPRARESAARGGNGHRPGRRIGTSGAVSVGRSGDGES
jgi:hypothetical protein